MAVEPDVKITAEVDLGPWKDLVEAMWSLGPVFDAVGHQFEGLLAVLDPKRPRNGPPKLCIDGHAYHRRQRNRVKRGR